MSVDTKGVVETKNKDVFLVAQTVSESLTKYLQDRFDYAVMNSLPWIEAQKININNPLDRYRMCSINIEIVSQKSLRFTFKSEGQYRQLWVHFNCEPDFKELCQHGLSFSLGCWGESGELVKQVGFALNNLFKGRFWFKDNDCEEQWEILR